MAIATERAPLTLEGCGRAGTPVGHIRAIDLLGVTRLRGGESQLTETVYGCDSSGGIPSLAPAPGILDILPSTFGKIDQSHVRLIMVHLTLSMIERVPAHFCVRNNS